MPLSQTHSEYYTLLSRLRRKLSPIHSLSPSRGDPLDISTLVGIKIGRHKSPPTKKEKKTKQAKESEDGKGLRTVGGAGTTGKARE